MKDSINVLGQEYALCAGTPEQYPHLNDATGYTDLYAKKIVVDVHYYEKGTGYKTENPARALNKVYRHEIVHAFFKESGMDYLFDTADEEELMVNWVAEQFPKLQEIFEGLGVDK